MADLGDDEADGAARVEEEAGGEGGGGAHAGGAAADVAADEFPQAGDEEARDEREGGLAAREEGEVHVGAHEDEEGGQEEDGGHALQALVGVAAQGFVAADEGADGEGSEEGVQAREVGEEGGAEDGDDEDDEVGGGADLPMTAQPDRDPPIEKERGGEERREEEGVEGEVARQADGAGCDGEGEDHPADDVVDRAGAQDDGSQGRAGEAHVGQEAGEDGQCAHGHDDGDDDGAAGSGGPGQEPAGLREGQREAEGEGDEEASGGDEGGRAGFGGDPARLGAGDVHEEDEAEPPGDFDDGAGLAREDGVVGLGPEVSEDGGAEQESEDELAEDGRLAQARGERAQEGGAGDDREEGQQEGVDGEAGHACARGDALMRLSKRVGWRDEASGVDMSKRGRHAFVTAAFCVRDPRRRRDRMRIVTAEDVNELFRTDADVIVLDVLGEESYRERHLPGAINVPVESASFVERVQTLVPDKGRTIVTYCADAECDASTKAARTLEGLGYAHILEFKDGLKGWTQAGYALEPSRSSVPVQPDVAVEE